MTPQQQRQYREAGYTTVPGFFAANEIGALREQAQRWIAAGELRDVAVSASKRNLQRIPLWPHSRLFRALPFHPRVVAAVSALLGDPVVKILDQMFHKPAGDGMGTNWHTDNAYFRIDEPLRGCAMWIAIDDASVDNGCLHVVPGAFDRDFPHERDPESDHHIRTVIDPAEAVPCELEAGGVAFFSFGTPHATGANPTAKGRSGVGIHFVNYRHASDAMRRRERWERVFLTGSEASGGVREYGERVCFAEELEALRLGGG